MTKHEAEQALYLMRNQLDKLPVETTEHLENAYTIVYEMFQTLEEAN